MELSGPVGPEWIARGDERSAWAQHPKSFREGGWNVPYVMEGGVAKYGVE